MFTSLKLASRLSAAALAITGLLLPAVASAQYAPPPGQQPYPPSYGQPSYAQPQDETIHGRIYSINATFSITVTDDNGYMDNVELHQGTIINPTGLTLAPGMEVTIAGYSAGSAFEANEIDTPYTYSGPAPIPVYYGPGWWYPGFGYGYGPSFVLDFGFFGGGYRFERHDFNYHTFWAPRRDDRFRGNNGFAPRTAPRYQAPRNDGNRTYSAPNRGYSAPARTWNGNAGTNYSGNRGYSAPAHTWNGGGNTNVNYGGRNGGNINYNGGNNGYRGGNTNGGNNGYRSGNNNGGNNYRSAPQTQPATTRSTGANESRSTHTDNGNHGDNGNHHGH